MTKAKNLLWCLMLVAFILGRGYAFGEIHSLTLGVDGVACPFCVYGLEKHLNNASGVESVEFNLSAATADLQLKAGSRLDLRSIQQAITDAGFTMRDLDIQVSGTLSNDGKFWVLVSTKDFMKFILVAKGNQHLDKIFTGKLSTAESEGREITVWGKVHTHSSGPPDIIVEKCELLEK